MHLEIPEKKLLNLLHNVMKGLESNPPLVSLKGILVEVTKTHVIFITSNGDLSVRSATETNDGTKVFETGFFLVPGRLFFEVVRRQPKPVVVLKTDGKTLRVSGKGTDSNITINLFLVDDYPKINFEITGGQTVNIPITDFQDIVSDVVFAAAENHRNLIYNGVNFQVKNNVLTISATNTYRFATKTVKTNGNNDVNLTILTKNVKKLLPQSFRKNVVLVTDGHRVNVQTGDVIVQSKLLTGVFPDLNSYVPNSFKRTLSTSAYNLRNCVERAAVVNEFESSSVYFEVTSDNKVFVHTQRSEVGQTKIALNKFTWEGEPFGVSFDSRYFLEALRPFHGNVTVFFNGDLEPFILKSNDKKGLIQLVLPQRTYG